jgi:hypothetical protein
LSGPDGFELNPLPFFAVTHIMQSEVRQSQNAEKSHGLDLPWLDSIAVPIADLVLQLRRLGVHFVK